MLPIYWLVIGPSWSETETNQCTSDTSSISSYCVSQELLVVYLLLTAFAVQKSLLKRWRSEMYSIVRARLLSNTLKKARCFCSSVSVNPSKESIASASSLLDGQTLPPPNATPPPQSLSSGTEKKPWNFLKYGLVAALTGGFATAGYATYGACPLHSTPPPLPPHFSWLILLRILNYTTKSSYLFDYVGI